MGLKPQDEKQVAPRKEQSVVEWDDGGWAPGVWLPLCWCRLTNLICKATNPTMPAAMSLSASTGLFEPMICSPASPPGPRGPGPCRVGRTSLRDGSRNGQQGSCSPLFGLICGDGLRLCLPFCDMTWPCARHLAVMPRALARPLAAASRLHARARLVVALCVGGVHPFVVAAHGCASPLVAPLVVARTWRCSLAASFRLHIQPLLAPRALVPRTWRRWLSQPR
jgi:hypothetical protein